MRTGLHPYSLSQPPPLLPELMDKLGIELALEVKYKNLRTTVLRGHACIPQGTALDEFSLDSSS